MKSKTKFSRDGGKKGNVKVSSKTKSDPATGFKKLFVDELKDIYWAEKALIKALPKVADKTTSEELSEAILNHLAETENHVTRLEEVFSLLEVKAEGKKCEAMEGLIKETERIIEETESGMVRDAGIIAAAQKVEHYEIATYGTLCSFARILDETEIESLLEDTLNEEKEADETLTEIAESSINIVASEYEEELVK